MKIIDNTNYDADYDVDNIIQIIGIIREETNKLINLIDSGAKIKNSMKALKLISHISSFVTDDLEELKELLNEEYNRAEKAIEENEYLQAEVNRLKLMYEKYDTI